METEMPSWRQVWIIARQTVREARRQRLFAALLLVALALLAGAAALRNLNFGRSEAAFLADGGFAVMTLAGSALAIALTTQLIFGEIESRTVLTLLAKPVARADFVVGKFLGIVAVLAAFCALITGLLLLVIGSRSGAPLTAADVIRSPVPTEAILLGGYLQWLKLTILAALVLLVASYARTQLFVIMAGTILLCGGHLQSVAHDAYARSGLWLVRLLGGAVTSVLPDFNLFAPVFSLGGPADLGGMIPLTLYAAAYIALGCGLATYCFQRREF